MQEEGASLPTSTLFHLLLLVSTKSYCQQCLGGGGQPVTLIPIPPGWVSSESWAPSPQLPATAHRYPIDAPTCSGPENIPTQCATGVRFNPVWIPLGVPSFILSLSPKVFFMVLLTSLLIISDTGNDSFTSGDQAGVTFRHWGLGHWRLTRRVFSFTTGGGERIVSGNQCAEARAVAQHPRGKNIPLNSELSNPKCRWTWVWVNSGSWWWAGRPGVLRFMGSQRVGHDWATKLNWSVNGRYSWETPHKAFLAETTVWFLSPPWTLTHAGVDGEVQAGRWN